MADPSALPPTHLARHLLVARMTMKLEVLSASRAQAADEMYIVDLGVVVPGTLPVLVTLRSLASLTNLRDPPLSSQIASALRWCAGCICEIAPSTMI